MLGFSHGPGVPAASKEPSVLLTKEVLRREREARPALRALIQGESMSALARRHRNVAWHNKDIPPAGAPEAAWTAAQRGARLGQSHPPACHIDQKVITKYIVIEVPPVLAPGVWKPSLNSEETTGSSTQTKPSADSSEETTGLSNQTKTSADCPDPVASWLEDKSELFRQLALRSNKLELAVAACIDLADKVIVQADDLFHENVSSAQTSVPSQKSVASVANPPYNIEHSRADAAELLIERARKAARLGHLPPTSLCTNRFGKCYRLPSTTTMSVSLKKALKVAGWLAYDNGDAFLVLDAPTLVGPYVPSSAPSGGIFSAAVNISTAKSASTEGPFSAGLSDNEKRASPGPWSPSFKRGT